MKSRFFYFLSMLVGVGFLLSGCGTTGPGPTGPSAPSRDPNKPQTFLAGAKVQQAKSIAMGSAVSKGWEIVDSSGDRLLVRRPLDVSAARSAVGEPVSTAAVEVSTDFFERREGVDVAVGAAVIANQGTTAEKNIDFTDSYRGELNRSLDSLRRKWEEGRWRVASATPPLPTKVSASTSADPGAQSTPDAVGREPIADERQPIVDSAPLRQADERVVEDRSEPVAPVVAPVSAPSAPDGVAPVEERTAPMTMPTTTPRTAAASPAEEGMLVLNRQSEPGVWSYYAEHYARIRGCEVADNGAVLEEKRPEYEIHRVYCENGQSLLVSCNAGACRGMP